MKKIIIISTISLLIFVIFSCKKDENINEPDKTINPIEPTGNNLINFQTTFGNANSKNSIYQIKSDNSGNFYYTGIKDGNDVIGKLNTSGSIIWEKYTNFIVNDFCFYNDYNTSKNYIILAGENENYSNGIIAIYNKDGDFVSDEMWSKYNTVFFNTVSPSINIDNIQFLVAAGGAGNTTICPYITNFHISNTGKIIKEFPNNIPSNYDELLTNYSNFRFSKLISEDEESRNQGGREKKNSLNLHAMMYYKQLDIIKYFSATNFSLEISDIFKTDINWIVNVKNNNPDLNAFYGNICKDDENNIYVVGRVDGEKIESSKNDYWRNCIAAKISTQGELLWKKEYEISNYSDYYKDCIFFNNYLYAVGNSVSYCNNETNSFSYGLISKINSSSGNLISSKMIGEDTSSSGLNTMQLYDNKLYIGGYIHKNQCTESTFQSWFLEFNQSGI